MKINFSNIFNLKNFTLPTIEPRFKPLVYIISALAISLLLYKMVKCCCCLASKKVDPVQLPEAISISHATSPSGQATNSDEPVAPSEPIRSVIGADKSAKEPTVSIGPAEPAVDPTPIEQVRVEQNVNPQEPVIVPPVVVLATKTEKDEDILDIGLLFTDPASEETESEQTPLFVKTAVVSAKPAVSPNALQLVAAKPKSPQKQTSVPLLAATINAATIHDFFRLQLAINSEIPVDFNRLSFPLPEVLPTTVPTALTQEILALISKDSQDQKTKKNSPQLLIEDDSAAPFTPPGTDDAIQVMLPSNIGYLTQGAAVNVVLPSVDTPPASPEENGQLIVQPQRSSALVTMQKAGEVALNVVDNAARGTIAVPSVLLSVTTAALAIPSMAAAGTITGAAGVGLTAFAFTSASGQLAASLFQGKPWGESIADAGKAPLKFVKGAAGMLKWGTKQEHKSPLLIEAPPTPVADPNAPLPSELD